MEEKKIHDELASIRSLMERSSKFISLSGLSGILAGVYALIGAGVVYYMIYSKMPAPLNPYVQSPPDIEGASYGYISNFPLEIVLVPIVILLLSITTGILLSKRK